MESLKKYLPGFHGKKILVFGDLMLDEHIWSRVSRISPEAPVPVADVIRITHVPGRMRERGFQHRGAGRHPLPGRDHRR